MGRRLIQLLLFFGMIRLESLDFPNCAEAVTEKWLMECAEETGYTDHIPHFKIIFACKKMHTFLEFGLGFATKFFLDHCDRVISVEFVIDGYGPDWLKECLYLFRNSPHWIPIAYFSDYQGDQSWAPQRFTGSTILSDACRYQCVTHKNYALIDDSYIKELDGFLQNLVHQTPVDIAFVDAGMYLRGDLVQLLFGKVPLIVAHDCPKRSDLLEDVYGYARIKPPEDYEEICFKTGQHTTIWIQKKQGLEELILMLKKYAAIF